ncbi:MAG TPA: (2Fe-2S)-binding protein [Burkholderiaceae bacterium]|uniref:Bacterioferritin-associated ferredoxin n=1 Tax=Caldimonas aquatica TaxID=376175 RepID=A0ABY6MN18_9BURK|nr:(2Fe-2S)-binding protein [Schlegelella aquatica]UZD53834.1 (2Fe-2S)-binding protein [Schlegelella aquatica]HWP17707.1 (2Fe-2S)-binding protein [Burkholderiaceae bacterium]
MIVCVCNRVSDREIERLARAGYSFEEIQMESGAATCCGRCESCARQVHEAARHQVREVHVVSLVLEAA